jgi:ribose 5-phosphate isomerase B
MSDLTIVIGSDHAGYALKAAIAKMLQASGLTVIDVGCDSAETPSDYPENAANVCQKLLELMDACQSEAMCDASSIKGIIVCGSGVGVSIAANRFNGIRAVLSHDLHTAALSRLHNDTNVLCLGARIIAPELAFAIVETWLSTVFEADRHQPRVSQLDTLVGGQFAQHVHGHEAGCC